MTTMTAPKASPEITVKFDHGFELQGTLLYHPEIGVLELHTDDGPERLSINLDADGLDTPADHVWIKDWSEHQGLTRSLRDAGMVRPVQVGKVGRFESTAYLVKLLFV